MQNLTDAQLDKILGTNPSYLKDGFTRKEKEAIVEACNGDEWLLSNYRAFFKDKVLYLQNLELTNYNFVNSYVGDTDDLNLLSLEEKIKLHDIVCGQPWLITPNGKVIIKSTPTELEVCVRARHFMNVTIESGPVPDLTKLRNEGVTSMLVKKDKIIYTTLDGVIKVKKR